MKNCSVNTESWLFDLAWLSVALAIVFALFLGAAPMHTPDGARYSEIPREMLATGNWLTPKLNYILYFEKPPLFYWMQIGGIKLLGQNEWGFRLMNALSALMGCLFTYAIARYLFSRRTALYAASILASSFLYFIMAHRVTLDITLTTWLTGSLGAFICAVKKPAGNGRRLLMWAAFVFAALAVLTKGLVGILIPCLIVGLWVLLNNQWRLLRTLYLPSSILLFLIIALPWHIAMQLQYPYFSYFYFVSQEFLRYLTMDANRFDSYFYIFFMLLLGFIPWSFFLIQATIFNLKLDSQHKLSARYLLTWAIAILVFFSLSGSQLIPYTLPILPSVAILTGHYFSSLEAKKKSRGLTAGFGGLVLSMLSIEILWTIIRYFFNALNLQSFYAIVNLPSITLIIGSVLATWLYWRKGLRVAFFMLLLTCFAYLNLSLWAFRQLDQRSIKPLALVINKSVQPCDEIVSYLHYYQDLPLYTKRKVTVVTAPTELIFGMQYQAHPWIIDKKTLWENWYKPRKIYMIIPQYDFKSASNHGHKLIILARTKSNVLVSNMEGHRECTNNK